MAKWLFGLDCTDQGEGFHYCGIIASSIRGIFARLDEFDRATKRD
jgi:hypothetical protein